MNNRQRYWGVIPASGVGKRMGSELPKQYLTLDGKTLLQHSIERMVAHPRIAGVVVAVAEHDKRWQAFEDHFGDAVTWVTGGAERYHSVLNALQVLNDIAAEDDWALVHDAARPCLRADDIDRLIDEANTGIGGILAAPVSDTMKRANADGSITETVNRAGLWRALTPQMFRIGLLIEAIEHAMTKGLPITDEASAIESLGHRPKIVAGHPDNIKITIPQDLELAQLYLQQQRTVVKNSENNR
ncbi:MAG: 2-C-methyl-D-erythritol 4-phosphate cytidylyltransferase [Gammaproteobacteria bacterium]|nr:2-C-methyl-D-erythritol 4-phosphate cytidylyltransferase [Gammaproteobacteria bacterium]